MECEEIKKIIEEQKITNISSEEFNIVKEHLLECQKCEITFKEHNSLRMLLKEYYHTIPISWIEKEKAFNLIERNIVKNKTAVSVIYKFALACIVLVIGFTIYKYMLFTYQKKHQLKFISDLIYVLDDKTQKWITLEYDNPTFKKIKKCKFCKYTNDMKILRFKVKNQNVSLFILNKEKFKEHVNPYKYYKLDSRFIYICETPSNIIHIWVSDIPLENVVDYLNLTTHLTTKNTIRIKTKKQFCPCCLKHLVKIIRRYNGYIININYNTKTSEFIIGTDNEKNISAIKKLF